MKTLFLVLSMAVVVSLNTKAQGYKIVLVDHKASVGVKDPSAKPIPFEIVLRDTILKSSADGILYIPANVYENRKTCTVRDFKFCNPKDEQKYDEPAFTQTIRRLMDYCDEGVLVAEKK